MRRVVLNPCTRKRATMPNNPANPPNGAYTSNCGNSGWSGSFTYTNGAIVYTRSDNPSTQYYANNTSQGNAMVFSITSGGNTIRFEGNYEANGNKAQYVGTCNDNSPKNTQDPWTATQE